MPKTLLFGFSETETSTQNLWFLLPRIFLLFSTLPILLSACSQPSRIDSDKFTFSRDTFMNKPAVPDYYIPTETVGTIYLTFDDGPLFGSENINKIIEAEKVRVNAFVVGRHVENSNKLKEMYDLYLSNPYIEIGNHSYSHAVGKYREFYSNTPMSIDDFDRCQHRLKIPTKLARLPGRNQWRLNTISKDDISSGNLTSDSLHKMGYKVYGWDLEWFRDTKKGGPKQSVDNMVSIIEKKLADSSTVRPGHLILLTHDDMFKSAGAQQLQQLIEKLKATKKYAFDHLSNYPG